MAFELSAGRCVFTILFLTCGLLGGTDGHTQQENNKTWQRVQIPDAWKKPPAGLGGYSWYRCLVKIPFSWRDRQLTLFVEPVDDAREVYVNGVRMGTAGSFPPRFRSGLGAKDRHPVDAQHVNFEAVNLVALRIYCSDGRTGFNVAAPAFFAGDEAIHLAGAWQFHSGDSTAWAKGDDGRPSDAEFLFETTQPAAKVEKILRRLPGEEGPLTVPQALQRFKIPDELIIESVLSEPEIGQPVFIDFDECGRLWVLNYKQYPHPAGLKAVSRDKFLRTVYDKVPPPPPNHFRGRDKITIHEDTNGDGVFDKHKTFVDGLNIATAFARGRGGVFVLNPPYLLFYPDGNNDDVPDGDPQVLLEGFGLEDSHAVVSHLRWGPDGWLYGAQGSTVTGHVKRYGTPDKPVDSMGQLIWRYHPESAHYEIFSEGGGNTFGVEIDSKGRIFSGYNGGDTRGFHYVQGGYSRKGFGKHGELSNPYAFGYFSPMPHAPAPRFTHAFIIYEAATLPTRYAGRLIAVAPRQSKVICSDIQPHGSSFRTQDIDNAVTSSDPWFRPVEIKVGPDGAIYICDFHEQRIDHASHYQGRVTPDTGRIYRLAAREVLPGRPFDYATWSSTELVQLLSHNNKWHRQTALRLIADRKNRALRGVLSELIHERDGQTALEALWALNLCGGFDEAVASVTLGHRDPFVRAWTVRLLCDDFQVSDQIAVRLADLAKSESNVEVRCQLACSARRLPVGQGLPMVKNLLAWAEDKTDSFLPLLLWWAIEVHTESGRAAVVDLFRDAGLWGKPMVQQHILERVMRRYAQAGGRANLQSCATLLELSPTPSHVQQLMKGFETALTGRTLSDLPTELTTALANVGGGSLELRLRRADGSAIAEALQLVAADQTPDAERVRYIRVLGQINYAECVSTLLDLASTSQNPEIRSAALTSLQAYDDAHIGTEVVRMHNSLSSDVQSVAQTLLASRHLWARELLSAVETGAINSDAVPPSVVQKILFHDDQKIAERVRKQWGDVQVLTTEEMRTKVRRLHNIISGAAGNPYKGKKLFLKHCGKCHVLFKDGGQIGPDLTSYQRDDLHSMLLNIVNPSLEIREGFENFVVFTNDGRNLNGFVADQDKQVVVLKGEDGQSVIIPRDEIDEMQAIPRSIMPEGILNTLGGRHVRDLFAYLRSTQPLP